MKGVHGLKIKPCKLSMSSNIVIGIEGLVGSGKTSICRELLKHIPNSIILHGGNLYRGIVYALMNSSGKIDLNNLTDNIKNVDIKNVMELLKIEFKIENRETVVYANGVKLDEANLQSEENSLAVSMAGKDANNQAFYEFARELIDGYKEKFNVIVSGRDLMQIYPKLDYHFFIEASLEERIQRKMHQYGNDANYDGIKDNIEKRDKLQKAAGYYKIYEQTIKVDVTDCKSAEESALKVLKFIEI